MKIKLFEFRSRIVYSSSLLCAVLLVSSALADNGDKISKVDKKDIRCSCQVTSGGTRYTVKGKALMSLAVKQQTDAKILVWVDRKIIKKGKPADSCKVDNKPLYQCWLPTMFVDTTARAAEREAQQSPLVNRTEVCQEHAVPMGAGECEKPD